jgi:hypothetical protein
MKARFTDEQIIAMIKEQKAGEKTADVCLRHVEPPPLKWSDPIVRKTEDQRWPLRDPSLKRLS